MSVDFQKVYYSDVEENKYVFRVIYCGIVSTTFAMSCCTARRPGGVIYDTNHGTHSFKLYE